MLRVITLNVNGIRSAARKGFFDWLSQQDADIICLQELKAQKRDLVDSIFYPQGYSVNFHCAEKRGYSGVAIYTRLPYNSVKIGLGWEVADTEGRYIEVDFGDFVVASLYLPSGTSGEHRQNIKFDFLARFRMCLLAQIKSAKPHILCGDWNIAHHTDDLANWKGNLKNSGFLPREREFMDDLFGKMGFIDVFRKKIQGNGHYTWWSNRGQARAKNVGWRIDYQVATKHWFDLIRDVNIYPEPFLSDHAPLVVDYNLAGLVR